MPVLERLRRNTALRVLLVVAAVLASQSSLACAVEESFAPATEFASTQPLDDSPADAPDADGCCALCTDCAHSGGCCSFAASPRTGAALLTLDSPGDGRIGTTTTAPLRWNPPTLLRPPIDLA
jgi:hypothetical protein